MTEVDVTTTALAHLGALTTATVGAAMATAEGSVTGTAATEGVVEVAVDTAVNETAALPVERDNGTERVLSAMAVTRATLATGRRLLAPSTVAVRLPRLLAAVRPRLLLAVALLPLLPDAGARLRGRPA
jgi:outer membrane lipoprotein SlyB